MRRNQKNESGYESQRRFSGRERDFDSDSDLYDNEDDYRSESRPDPRSDYDYEQSDRVTYGSSPMDTTGRLSGSGRREAGYGSSWTQGAHAGKGPKGYQRSEERIREDICDALEAHAHIDASDIDVEVSEGLVTLTGTVDSRQAKRLAEQAVETVRGIKDINNELRIMSTHENVRDAKSFTAAKTKSGKKSSSNYKQ